jgi:hypothetical protein
LSYVSFLCSIVLIPVKANSIKGTEELVMASMEVIINLLNHMNNEQMYTLFHHEKSYPINLEDFSIYVLFMVSLIQVYLKLITL